MPTTERVMVTERQIRQTLRRLARQRVAFILQPGNVWVVERAVDDSDGEDVAAALRTCQLRGWVGIEVDAVPKGSISPRGELPLSMDRVAPVYRLTEAGWSVVHRSHGWVLATFLVASVTLIATVLALAVSLWPHR